MVHTAGFAAWAQITYRLSLFSSRISHQNTHFNMSTETSILEGSSCKKSRLECFKSTNFDRFHCEAKERGASLVGTLSYASGRNIGKK